MKQGNLKPWSQLDDESEERAVPDSPSVDGLAQQDADADSTTARPRFASGVDFVWRRVTPQWALAPFAIASLWLLGALIAAGERSGVSITSAIGILSLSLLGCGLLQAGVLARRAAASGRGRNAGGAPQNQTAGTEEPPADADLQSFYQQIESHAGNVERRVAELVEEHKHMSLELSLAETRRRQAEAVIGSISDPLIVTDAFGQLILANAAAEALLAFKRDESLRKPIAEVIGDESVVSVIKRVSEADVRAANRTIQWETDSQTYAIKFSPFLPDTASGGTGQNGHGVVAIFRNVTKERQADKNKSEFVAHAAHELRTPLSSIRAYVEMLVDGEVEDEKTREEYYEIIYSSADRLGRMIDNILNISRIEAGTVRINREPVAISMVVKEAIDVVRPQAEEKRIDLTEELTPVVFRVEADRDMIYQAILNLLSNAIKYTPEGGKVHVRMAPHEEDRIISIKVRDSGVGIPKEDLPRMFEKFFRVEANKKMAKGTGLGLNLVKNIVETIHKGKMTLTSEVGSGSTFGMDLPLMK
jgi:two-component system phosphate regulon sensor histidine kinase PhoR